jgi:hypothetical protein
MRACTILSKLAHSQCHLDWLCTQEISFQHFAVALSTIPVVCLHTGVEACFTYTYIAMRPQGLDGLKKQLNKAFEKQYKAAYNLASKAVRALERAAKQAQMAMVKSKSAGGAGGGGGAGKKGKRPGAAGETNASC